MLGDLAAAIIEKQEGSDMYYLCFDYCCLKNPGEEPEVTEKRFIDALLNSKINKLTHLSFGGNAEWFN